MLSISSQAGTPQGGLEVFVGLAWCSLRNLALTTDQR